jgi:hypothetical protein
LSVEWRPDGRLQVVVTNGYPGGVAERSSLDEVETRNVL